MKRFFALTALLMLVAGGAVAQPYLFEHNNEIGVYMVENPTAENAQDMSCYNVAPGQFIAYVVLTNPYNDNLDAPITVLGGFEFSLSWNPGLFFTAVIHPSATNFQSSPDFYCGANIPVVGGQCTLITCQVGTFTATPDAWYIGPVSDSGTHSIPGSIAITDLNDNYSISEAFPSSGDFADPVFAMFDCLVVPNEDVSFGGVKALFQ